MSLLDVSIISLSAVVSGSYQAERNTKMKKVLVVTVLFFSVFYKIGGQPP
jgi:hypothetical protein